MFPSIKYSSSNQSGGFLLLQSLPGHPLTCSFPFSGQIWSPWTKWDERMLTKQQIDRKRHHNPLTSRSAETLWTERTPNSPLHLQCSHPGPPADPGARRCRGRDPGGFPEPRSPRARPRSRPGAYLGQARVRRGWRREAGRAGSLAGRRSWQGGWQGREAGREAGGPRGAPGAGTALLPTRGCERPAGHGAAQAAAPARAASWEAAPLLGVTISPATQSRPKTSPSSTAVISTEGAGLAGWEWHRTADLANTDTFSLKKTRTPKSNTDGKQGGPHWKMLLGQGCAALPVQQHHLLGGLAAQPEHLPGKTLHSFPLPSTTFVYLLPFQVLSTFPFTSYCLYHGRM